MLHKSSFNSAAGFKHIPSAGEISAVDACANSFTWSKRLRICTHDVPLAYHTRRSWFFPAEALPRNQVHHHHGIHQRCLLNLRSKPCLFLVIQTHLLLESRGFQAVDDVWMTRNKQGFERKLEEIYAFAIAIYTITPWNFKYSDSIA